MWLAPIHADKDEAGNSDEDAANSEADAINRNCGKRKNDNGEEMEAIKNSIFVLFINLHRFRISLPQEGSRAEEADGVDEADVRGQGHGGWGQGPGHQRGEAEEDLGQPEESKTQVRVDRGGWCLVYEAIPAEETDVDNVEDEAEEKTNTATCG